MKKIIIILISILLLIIDNTIAPFFSIQGAFPSLLFVFIIAYSMINGYKEAVFVGVIAGLLQDIYFSGGMGINAITNLWICLLAAYIGASVFKRGKLIPVGTMFGLTILKHLAVFVIFYAMGKTIRIDNTIFVAIYNSVIMFIAYNFIYNFSNRNGLKDKWRLR